MMTEVWKELEGQVINGVFPLRRLLGTSDHSAVFLTDSPAQNIPEAAIKLIQATQESQVQLAYWRTAASLSHPHLIGLLDSGRCQLEGIEFLYVVMEYAEQTLAQILPQRALTAGEGREMLIPTLGALAYLHDRTLVQGRLKPSNILVVKDQLKLASDTVRPAEESAANFAGTSTDAPPQAKDGAFSAAGDMWSLGMTMVEALTQRPPSWPDSHPETPFVAGELPPSLANIVKGCLNRNPANRPSAADLEAAINPAPPLPDTTMPTSAAAVLAPLKRVGSKERLILPAIAVLLLVVIALWAGRRMLGSQSAPQQLPPIASASETLLTPKPTSETSGQADQSVAPSSQPTTVLHEEIPDLARGVRGTIHGHIKVDVRVTVDASGNVVEQTLGRAGTSPYFDRLAGAAAGKWKFAPSSNQDPRAFLLRFEFTRNGATAHAAASRL